MFPWTHAAVGYLCFLMAASVLAHRASRVELLALVVGTQLADGIDKPLAWWVAVLPSGRSLGHSLLFAVPVVAVVLAVAWHRAHPEVGLAFAFGYLTHLVGDTYVAVYYGRTEEFTFLLWPILPPYPYDDFAGFVDFAGRVELSTQFVGLFVVAAAAGALFLVQFSRAPWWHPRRSG